MGGSREGFVGRGVLSCPSTCLRMAGMFRLQEGREGVSEMERFDAFHSNIYMCIGVI